MSWNHDLPPFRGLPSSLGCCWLLVPALSMGGFSAPPFRRKLRLLSTRGHRSWEVVASDFLIMASLDARGEFSEAWTLNKDGLRCWLLPTDSGLEGTKMLSGPAAAAVMEVMLVASRDDRFCFTGGSGTAP